MKRDLLSLAELDREEILAICDDAARLKVELRAGRGPRSLVGKTLAMIFEKPSLRTRVTFETGVKQLGGASVYLTHEDIRLGERETVADIARNLSRWVDLIVARTFSHTTLVELARHATIPVINGLTDLSHPCQRQTKGYEVESKAPFRVGGKRSREKGNSYGPVNEEKPVQEPI